MADQSSEQRTGNYRALWLELARRTREPLGHPSFVIYFLLAVVGFAGLGLWLELYAYFTTVPAPSFGPLRTALTTFFPALAGSTALQLIWAEHQRFLRSFAVLCLVILLLMAVVTAANSRVQDFWAVGFGILSSVAACWIWWITNADQPDFRDEIDPDDAVGGGRDSLNKAQLPGSLEGIDH